MFSSWIILPKIDHERNCDRMRYECCLSKYCATYKNNLNAHIRIHSRGKPFICSLCFKSFSLKNHLNDHSRTHATALQFDCSKCGQRFAKKRTRESREQCCQRRQFECHLCRYICFNRSQLIMHIKLKHNDVKPIYCNICGKIITNRNDLNQHLFIHRNKLPHSCSECPRAFSTEIELISHKQNCRHRQFQCYLCQAIQHNIADLRNHM